MKILIVVVALIGLVFCDSKCTSSSSPSLEDDFNDITKLIPTADVKKISQKYSNDDDVKKIVKFLTGDTFASTFKYAISQKAFINLNQFLCANGLTFIEHVNKVNDLLGLPQYNTTAARSSEPRARISELGTRTFKAILQEVEAVLPLTQMKAVFEEKKTSSTAFKTLYDTINSKEFAAFVKEIHDLPSNLQGNAMLAQLGVDYKYLFRVYQELIGWEEIYSSVIV